MEQHKRLIIGCQLVSDELKMLREKSEVNHLKNYFSESKENFLEVQIIVEDVNRDLECEKVRGYKINKERQIAIANNEES